MAEIRVQEEKRGGLGWLWALLLVLLVALIAWYFLMGRGDGTTDVGPVTEPTPASPTAAPSLPGHRPAEAMIYRRA